MPEAQSLSPQVWEQIYRAIRSEQRAHPVSQGVVTNRDKAKNVVWVSELSSDPIEVVGQAHEMTYFVGGQQKIVRIPPAVPEIGDVVLIVRTGGDNFRCVGSLASASKWQPSPSAGIIPPDSITAREIAADAVTASEIAADAVGASELADLSVDTAALQDGAVTNAKVATAAAIARSKLNFGSGLVDADIAAAAAIARSKLNFGAGLINTDFVGGYPGLVCSRLSATGAVTLTSSNQDVPGCSLSFAAGNWLFIGTFDFQWTVNAGGTVAVGVLVVNGVEATGQALLMCSGAASGDRVTVTQVWAGVNLPSAQTVKLQARKSGAAGTAVCNQTHTCLSWLQVGP